MSFTDVGQVLQLQGGTPLLKSGSVFSENLPVSKNLQSPTPGNMLPNIMSGGLASIMQNPMSAITSLVSGQLSGMIQQLAGAGAAGASVSQTTSALTNMISSVGGLDDSSGYLSGATPAPAGTYGHRDLAGHYRTAFLLGDNPPSSLSPATASAPLSSQDLLTSLTGQAAATVGDLLSGTISDAIGAASVNALTAQIDAVVDDSDAAITNLRALIPVLADVSAIGAAAASAVVSRSDSVPNFSDPNGEAWDVVLQTVVQPWAYAALKNAALAACEVPPPVLGPVAPTVPVENVSIRAAIVATPDSDQSVEVV